MLLEDVKKGVEYKTKENFVAIHGDTNQVRKWAAGTAVTVFGKNDSGFSPHCTSVLVADGQGFATMVGAHMLEEI